MTRDAFLVGEANARAIALVDAWPEWPQPAVLLAGPGGSGKTHVVEIWRVLANATVIPARNLDDSGIAALVGAGPVAVEDLHAGPFDEAALFHLLNLAAERGMPMLLTSRAWPSALPVRLADLASRLRAARLVEIGEPDDDLRRRVLVKLFADRQLAVEAAVMDYILLHMERSLEAANRVVEEIDREALAAGAPVTRRLAAAAMVRLAEGAPD
ncbi:MAG TPA: DnaA/Hda family protein [Bauldia sp.]|nr:DnaA/Hda family protein [Bauldia sp.]